MSVIRKHRAVLQASACLALVFKYFCAPRNYIRRRKEVMLLFLSVCVSARSLTKLLTNLMQFLNDQVTQVWPSNSQLDFSSDPDHDTRIFKPILSLLSWSLHSQEWHKVLISEVCVLTSAATLYKMNFPDADCTERVTLQRNCSESCWHVIFS